MPMELISIVRATRHAAAEGRVDLRIRRAWFAEADGVDPQTETPDPNAGNGQSQSAPQDKDGIDALPDWAQAVITGLRSENAEWRTKLRKVEDDLRKREQKALAEQGNFKQLYEQTAQEIEGLKPYRERVSQLEGLIKKSNDAQIAKIPEAMRPLVPVNYSPEDLRDWLDANVDRLTRAGAPNLDAGTGGMGGQANVTVTERDRLLAAAAQAQGYKVTPEQIARRRSQKQ